MATVYFLHHSQRTPIPQHNAQFSSLLSSIQSIVGFRPTQLQYMDEDGDFIRVESQFDFQEALTVAESTGEITFQLLAGVEELPLVQSQVLEPELPAVTEVGPPITQLEKPVSPPFMAEKQPPNPPLVQLEKPVSPPVMEVTRPTQGVEEVKVETGKPAPLKPETVQKPTKPVGFDPNLIQQILDDELKCLLFPQKRSLLRSQISQNTVHYGIKCSRCGVLPIRGARFRCEECKGLELCEDCEDREEHPHVLVKYRVAEEKKQQVQVVKPAPVPAPAPAKSDRNEAKIKQIVDLGFSYEQAVTALEVCQGDVNLAVDQLFG